MCSKIGWWDGLYDSSGVDEDVYGTEVLHHVRNGLVDGFRAADVDFIERGWDSGAGVEIEGGTDTDVLLYVEDGDGFDTDFCKGHGHVVTETAGPAGSVSCLNLQSLKKQRSGKNAQNA